MSYALYVDPAKKSVVPELPAGKPEIAYYRLIDCSEEQLEEFNPGLYPKADFTIAEIHAAQMDRLDFPVDRFSIVQQKSAFRDLTGLKSRLPETQYDITFVWDKRFTVDYYIRMLRFWIQCGVQHFSFYDLVDFDKWQRLSKFMSENGFRFYDRFHASLPGFESRYQKHIASYGDLYAIGGWSRVTENGLTRTKGPIHKNWRILTEQDQITEKLLFAMADCDGIELAQWGGYITENGAENVLAQGLARMENARLVPSDTGLWKSVELASHLHNP